MKGGSCCPFFTLSKFCSAVYHHDLCQPPTEFPSSCRSKFTLALKHFASAMGSISAQKGRSCPWDPPHPWDGAHGWGYSSCLQSLWSQERGCGDGQGQLGRDLQGQKLFLALRFRPSIPSPWQAEKILVPSLLWRAERLFPLSAHYRSGRKPGRGFAMLRTGASETTCELMLGSKCPNPMALR